MYICAYIYIYTPIPKSMHAGIYTCMHVWMHGCMYRCMHVCMQVGSNMSGNLELKLAHGQEYDCLAWFSAMIPD